MNNTEKTYILKELKEKMLDLSKLDDELYFRVIKRAINNYKTVIEEEKEQICSERGYHDFDKWIIKKEDRVPKICYSDDLDREPDGIYYIRGISYSRECKYCGKIEKVYNETQMDTLTTYNSLAKKRALNLKKKED